MMKSLAPIVCMTAILFLLSACQKFLDIIPDNVPTLDNAFSTRHEAEKYLFTCYSYMRANGSMTDDPGIVGGDEIWRLDSRADGYCNIARGYQKVVSPYGDRWSALFRAIRVCHIFLDHIDDVPHMDATEKRNWIGEVKFLLAYYNFYLVRMYGPIPLMKENLPVNISVKQAKVQRAPVDSCFDYIVNLIDQAIPYLPLSTTDPSKAGRINKVIALSFKAKVLVYEASPLFNGNTAESSLTNLDGTQLFTPTFSKAKWDSAAVACKRAIEACDSIGLKLYYYQPATLQFDLSDTIMTGMSIRNSLCQPYNGELIWGNPKGWATARALEHLCSPQWDPQYQSGAQSARGELSPPLKIAAMFYTRNGLPIDEDKTWGYDNRFNLQVSGDSNKLYIRKGYTTAHFNFEREPRFYADLGFDGGIWYGQGRFNDKDYMNLFYLEAKYGQMNGYGTRDHNTATGYYIKKYVVYTNTSSEGNLYYLTDYPFPVMRLAGLYLLYAEALNESKGPGPEIYKYLNLIRERAGIPDVQYSWDHFSKNPSEYKTKEGLRKIIHRERLIELAFEGQRFWDLRRWKTAETEENMPITAWDLRQSEAKAYYRPIVIFNQKFGLKDYFWPIAESALEKNPNLVQNLGW